MPAHLWGPVACGQPLESLLGRPVTSQRETTRYASPSMRQWKGGWAVAAYPWAAFVGMVRKHDAGWTAATPTNHYAGLWPTKQAAAEVLVKQAGYELGEL